MNLVSEVQLEKKLASEPEPEREVIQFVPDMDKNISVLESTEPERKPNDLVIDFLKRNA